MAPCAAKDFHSSLSNTERCTHRESSIVHLYEPLAMSHDLLRLVQFLEVFLFLVRKCFSFCLNSLVHPLDAAETDDGACASFVDPSQCYLAHLPAFLLCKFLYTNNDLLVNRRSAGTGMILLRFLVCFGSIRAAKGPRRSREVASAQRCPL